MPPPWMYPIVAAGSFTVAVILAMVLPPKESIGQVSVAFVGNSIQYFNDMPRFLQALSDDQIQQNSCLHGDATFESLVFTGSGMYPKFQTNNALLGTVAVGKENGEEEVSIYDYGACTIPQLLFGYDSKLNDEDEGGDGGGGFEYVDDGNNPCFLDKNYRMYTTTNQIHLDVSPSDDDNNPSTVPKWDYVVLNDNSRAPGRYNGRLQSMDALETYYVPWLQEVGATPILLNTYGYWSQFRNLTEFVDVPTFTSYTYEGYLEYKALLDEQLFVETRIAPVGLAFLTVWEENYELWTTLFHYDEMHPSPSGSFLQGLVLFHAIYGRLPSPSKVLRDDTSTLWSKARRMQPDGDDLKPYPSRETAEYLFYIAKKVCIDNYVPRSLEALDYGEAVLTDDDFVTNYGI